MRRTAYALIVLAAGGLLAGCPGEEPTPSPTPREPGRTPDRDPQPVDPAPVTPTPAPAAKGAVEILVSAPRTAAEGDDVEVSLVVRNTSRVDVKNVVVSCVLPASVTQTSVAPEASVTGPLLTWQFASLAPYAAEHLRVRLTTDAAGPAEIQSTVRADGGLVHEATATIEVGGQAPAGSARLAVSVTCAPSVLVCDPLKYRATVRNDGAAQATGVRLVAALPAGLASSDGAREVTVSVGALGAGQQKQLEFEAKPTATGSFTTNVTVSGDGIANATATCVSQVTRPELTLTLDAATSSGGTRLEARTTLSNQGSGAARDARISLELPAGATFESASDGGSLDAGRFVRWTLGSVEPGRSQSVTATLRLQGGATQLLATADAYCAERASASARTAAPPAPALRIEARAPGTVTVGESVTYLVDVTNQGQGTANDIVVSCRVPVGQRFRSAEGPVRAAYRVAGDTITFDPIRSLSPGARLTYRVVADVESASDAQFTASLTSARITTPIRDEGDVAVTTPKSNDVEVSVSAPSDATVDETFDCTITVRNKGAGDVQGVVVSGQLPSALEYVAGSPLPATQGASFAWNIGTLRASESRTVTLTVRARALGALEVCADAAATDNETHRHCAQVTVAERTAIDFTLTCAATGTVGAPLAYEATVTNRGRNRLDRVVLTATLPDGLVTDRGERALNLLVGGIASGATRAARFDLVADRTGTFEVVATASAASGERTDARCTTTVAQPALDLTAEGPDSAAPGESVQYTLNVRNSGAGAASDCVLEYPLPAGTTFASATGGGTLAAGTVSWNLGVVEPGQTRAVTVTIVTDAEGTLTHVPSVRAAGVEPVTASKTTTVAPVPPTLEVSVDVGRTEVGVGRAVNCTVTVVNQGTSDARDVVVVCALAQRQEAVSAETSSAATHTLLPRRVTFSAVTLAPNERATFTVLARAKAPGDANVTGIVRAAGLDDPVRRQSPSIRQFRKKN